MKKIGIIGAFDFIGKDHGGQPVKTRELYYAFCEKYGENDVEYVETYGERNYIKLIYKSIAMLFTCSQIAILPAHNGIRIFAPLLSLLNKSLKRKLFYFVIGGWLPKLVENKKYLLKPLNSFDCIFAETNRMKNELNKLGLNNVIQIENFRNSTPVDKIKFTDGKTCKLCFFSRVVRQKGVLDAIDVVSKINSAGNKCSLDIYGSVDEKFKSEFESALNASAECIKYCGFVDPESSVETLKQYDLQLFPTQYATEGIPGSVVDSYFAGVPVVASKWNSFNDVITDGVTGVGFEFENKYDFYDKLNSLIDNPDLINEMKRNCIHESEKYTRKVAFAKISKCLAV